MNQQRAVAAAVSVALALAGCATASKDIATTYVSPNQYASYDCPQLAAEAGRIQTRVVQLGGRLDQAAVNDAGIMAVGLILFWPVLFALGGTKQQEAEYARLKGEYDAVEQMAIQKKCTHLAPAAPPGQTAASAAPTPAAGAPQPSGAPFASTQSIQQSPAAQSAVIPASVASQPSAAIPVAAASVRVDASSKYMISAERFAKDNGCGGAAATMNIRAPTYETFTVTCATGDPRLVRCDDGVCRELK